MDKKRLFFYVWKNLIRCFMIFVSILQFYHILIYLNIDLIALTMYVITLACVCCTPDTKATRWNRIIYDRSLDIRQLQLCLDHRQMPTSAMSWGLYTYRVLEKKKRENLRFRKYSDLFSSLEVPLKRYLGVKTSSYHISSYRVNLIDYFRG